MLKRIFFTLVLYLFAENIYSFNKEKLQLTAYIDTYYTSDNLDEEFPLFSSINHEREKFALNIAYLLFNYKDDNYRLKLALQEGDIVNNIYYEEPKNIQQANIGVRVIDGLWLDGGIFTTHIGGESTHPRMNFFSTHSAITFFEPTYQTGLKLSYSINQNLSAELQIINGNHLFGDNNKDKTIAYSINYENDKLNIFYSGMTGNEEPMNTEFRRHTYHNIFFHYKVSDKFEIKTQIDAASIDTKTEIKESTGKTIAWFYGAFLQSRYKFNDKFSSAVRYSYYSDTEGTYNLNVGGYDISFVNEYKPQNNSYIRLESRFLKNTHGSKRHSFIRDKEYVDQLFEVSLNFGLWFDLKF